MYVWWTPTAEELVNLSLDLSFWSIVCFCATTCLITLSTCYVQSVTQQRAKKENSSVTWSVGFLHSSHPIISLFCFLVYLHSIHLAHRICKDFVFFYCCKGGIWPATSKVQNKICYLTVKKKCLHSLARKYNLVLPLLQLPHLLCPSKLSFPTLPGLKPLFSSLISCIYSWFHSFNILL